LKKENTLQLNTKLEVFKVFRKGIAAFAEGKLDEAISLYREAIQIDPSFIQIYIHFGEALHRKGDLNAAKEQFFKARQLAWEANDKIGLFDSLFKIGQLNRMKIREGKLKGGEIDETIFYLEEALKLADELQILNLKVSLTADLAMVFRNKKDYERAVQKGQEALVLARQFHSVEDEALALWVMGDTYEAMKEPQKAYDSFYEAVQLKEKIKNSHLVVFFYLCPNRRGRGKNLTILILKTKTPGPLRAPGLFCLISQLLVTLNIHQHRCCLLHGYSIRQPVRYHTD